MIGLTPAPVFPVFGPRPWVMGILNVTPDSFSDGGRWDSTETAVTRGRALVAEGADLVDIGGESTRPGAHRVDVETERNRVLPVVRELAAEGIICSVDTTRSAVAAAALSAGATVINDVSGGLADPEMARVAADTRAPWILMHWRGHSDRMQDLARYRNVVLEVQRELLIQVEAALAAGVDERALILDPGLGFAKNADHNWVLLQRLPEFVELGLPVLLGASRKRFLGELLADHDQLRAAGGREAASAAVSVIAASSRVWGVRVHEPRPNLDAMLVEQAVRSGSRPAGHGPQAHGPQADGPQAETGMPPAPVACLGAGYSGPAPVIGHLRSGWRLAVHDD